MRNCSHPLSGPSFLKNIQLAFCIVLLLFIGACGSSEQEFSPEPESSPTPTRTEAPTYVESGDLASIVEHGHLRILSPPHSHTTHLPRQGFPHNHEHELLERFAESIGVQLGYVTVEQYQDLMPSLLEGKGDLIAANFTVTPNRKDHIVFTVPVTTVSEQIVTRQDDTQLHALSDLNGRTITVHRTSAFWDTVSALQKHYPDLHIQEAPEHVEIEHILDGIAQKEFDLTVADSNLINAMLAYRSDLRPALTITNDRQIAWGVRPDSTDLLTALNTFLNKAQLSRHRPSISQDDLPGIRKRQVLRVQIGRAHV